MSSRRRPLHTCGVAILSIAHIAYTESQDLSGPLGSLTREISRLIEVPSPVICALQYQWLAMLSFADDIILAIENRVETIFPPLNHVFNTIDKLVQFAETLPGKLDHAVREFPVIIHRYSLLEWAAMQVISWLHFWISILIQWGFGQAMEKEIMIDSNSEECNNGSSSGNQPVESSAQVGILNKENVPPKHESSEPETNTFRPTVKTDVIKSSYKEVLEKAKREENDSNVGNAKSSSINLGKETKENTKNRSVRAMKETEKEDVSDDEGGKRGDLNISRSDESIMRSDPILELFESGWVMTPAKDRKEGWLSRSVSYVS